MGGESGIRLAAIAAVVILALAGVGVALLDPTGSRLSLVLAFLAPTIVALLALARVKELNGEVKRLEASVHDAADRSEVAAVKVEAAAPAVEAAAERVEAAAAELHPSEEPPA